MGNIVRILLVLLLLLATVAIPVIGASPADPEDYVPSELVVGFNPGFFSSEQELTEISSQLHAHFNATVLENSSRLGVRGAQLVRLGDNVTVEEAIAWYRENSTVLFAEPDYIAALPPVSQPGESMTGPPDGQEEGSQVTRMMALRYPDDPLYSTQWNLKKIGLPAAWELTTGSGSVVIAVLDTGIDDTHPEFSGNIWTNPGEIAGNGIDDDGNGFVDDVHGWDFLQNDNSPRDDTGHGTEVASVIASGGNNGIGIAGVMWNVKILPVKIGDSSGFYGSNIVKGVGYANNLGAHIIVCSFGGYDYSNLEQAAFDQAEEPLFVCAAGNDGQNTDIYPHYPSGFANPNIISVAATDADDDLCYFSNYGENSVDVGAPGSAVPALSLNSQYYYIDGTSMATPHVAGLAGLVLSRNREISSIGVRRLIMDHADPTGLNGYVGAGGRINADSTVSAVEVNDLLTINATAGVGGTIIPEGYIIVSPGWNLTFAFVPDPGYGVSSVRVDGEDYGPVQDYTLSDIREDHDLRVSFAPVVATYTVSATAGVGGTITPSGIITVPAGSDRTFSIVPDPGYRILDVTVDSMHLGPVQSYTFSGTATDHSISATFTQAPVLCTITAFASQGGTVSPYGYLSVTPGSSLPFFVVPEPGYQVYGVIVDGINVGPVAYFLFSDIREDHTLTALFIPETELPGMMTLTLEPGWNFISTPGPLAQGQDTAGVVFHDVNTGGHSLFSYDAGSGEWNSLIADDVVVPLRGLWVYSTVQKDIPLYLDEDSETTAIPLYSGWNAIGCPASSDISARDALASIADSWSQVIGYDAGLQRYEVSLINGGSGTHSDSNTLAPGKGYWVFVRNPCSFR